MRDSFSGHHVKEKIGKEASTLIYSVYSTLYMNGDGENSIGYFG
jgi:hypothetical protein